MGVSGFIQMKFVKVMFSQVSMSMGAGAQAQDGGGVQAQAWEGLPKGEVV